MHVVLMPAVSRGIPEQLTPIRVLVPGTGPRFRSGGLNVARQTARILGQLRPTEVVTYRVREDGYSYLSDLLDRETSQVTLFGMSVGALTYRSWCSDLEDALWFITLIVLAMALISLRITCGFCQRTLLATGKSSSSHPLFLVPNALSSNGLIAETDLFS